jgi:hypothetical protein
MGDGSLFLRADDAGEGQLALDGLQLGADVTLQDGWSLKATLLSGQAAKDINVASGDPGSIALPEAMLVWTGTQDTFRFGRMYTAMGMEVVDMTQNATASHGLLFTYAIPFGQVGLDWHHAFCPSWSTDVWIYNGEDKVTDNNKGKTGGLGLTWNAGGAADKTASLMLFSGPEQANNEGNKRQRLCFQGQWTWGGSSLQWEFEEAQETFPLADFAWETGMPGTTKARWSGAGLIFKQAFGDNWAGFARAEVLKDPDGVRISDPIIASQVGMNLQSGLQATGFALGVERHWHATFTRLEVRQDELNTSVYDHATVNDDLQLPPVYPAGSKSIKSATSVTWSIGTSF